MLYNKNSILLIAILFFVSQKVYSQYGSNKEAYFYIYELKDSSKNYTELIDISNKLSRKVKYYYIISRELGIEQKLIWEVEGNYDDMMYRFKIPEPFDGDSINQLAITACFDDLLDPFEIDIARPRTEFNQVLKNDSISVNSITLKTNSTFDKDENYQSSGIIIKDNPSPRQIAIKGYFEGRALVVVNGLFFFEDIQGMLKDSIISEAMKMKGKKGFKKKYELYLQLLAFRGIDYQLTKSGGAIDMSFTLYQITVTLDTTNIDRHLEGLVHGGNILQTLAPLR
jgi:hypothetical protein